MFSKNKNTLALLALALSLILNGWFVFKYIETNFYVVGFNAGQTQALQQTYTEIMKQYNQGEVKISDSNGRTIILVPQISKEKTK